MTNTLNKYPENLPFPLFSGYKIKNEDAFISTKMSSGLTRQRRIFSVINSYISASWIFNEVQFELFESWFRYKTNYGTNWILMSLKNGTGIVEVKCRFQSSYEASLIGYNSWKVSANLEAMDLPVIDETTYDVIIDIDTESGDDTQTLSEYIDDLEASSDRLEKYINVDRGSIYTWQR